MKRDRKMGTRAAALTHTTASRVRFSEVDSMQVVWHGEYVRYFEDGREAFGRAFPGIGYLDFHAHGYAAPIVDLRVQYVAPLTINDVVQVETRFIDTVAAKICFEYIARKQGSGQLVATGRSVQVFIDRQGDICLNIPPFFEEWKRRWLAQG